MSKETMWKQNSKTHNRRYARYWWYFD